MSTVPFAGETFEMLEVSGAALLDFAEASSEGQDGNMMEGLASIKRLIRDCLSDEDWKRFWALARKTRATPDDLLKVVQSILTGETERPTSRPADSSAGPSVTEPKSEPSADVKVSTLAGRPDLRVMIRQAAKAS